jgi:nucleotide-binding universal stress UspA family protein
MSEIIIGVDGTERGEDAVAFGRRLAAFAGARVVLANAFPFDDIRGRATSLAYREALREESQAMLVAVRDRYGLDASTRPIAGTSPARALHELAEHDGAALVVVGSSHVGRARRVLPGSTGERLLHGSPCAVAVVPNGYRETEHEAPRRIGVGIDGTEVAADALRGAAELARSLGAELEIIWAFAPKVAPVDEQFLADVEREWRARVNETLKTVPPAMDAARVFVEDDPVDVLVEHSRELDLLVIGSRGYGPLRSVLLGGVSGRVIRDAACPVIVAPRGARVPLEALLATSEVSPAEPAAR